MNSCDFEEDTKSSNTSNSVNQKLTLKEEQEQTLIRVIKNNLSEPKAKKNCQKVSELQRQMTISEIYQTATDRCDQPQIIKNMQNAGILSIPMPYNDDDLDDTFSDWNNY